MSKEKLKAKRGITLIALVITIIVMLILVAATVTVALNGGLFSSAKKATADTEAARVEESELSNGQVNIDNTIYNSIEEYIGATSGEEYKTAAELFDVNEEKYSKIKDNPDSTTDDNLHIGDFINYTAGNWTQEEIGAIKIGEKNSPVTATGDKNNSPNQAYQFGGFAAGDSRDGNAKPYIDSYNGIKDLEGNAITGWRLFDVDEEENEITLISAGCPEDFYVPNNSTDSGNGGYISEYILSGNVNSSATGLSLTDSYTKRNWDVYKTGKVTGANAIIKADLDNWYKKYMEVDNSFNLNNNVSGFQKVYKTRYENLIDNYSYYWLASAFDSYSVYSIGPYGRDVGSNYIFAGGVRVLITLPSNIQLSKSKTVTVNKLAADDDHGGPYTYNVWDIK